MPLVTFVATPAERSAVTSRRRTGVARLRLDPVRWREEAASSTAAGGERSGEKHVT